MKDTLGQELHRGDFVLITFNNYLIPSLIISTTDRAARHKTDISTNTYSINSYDHIIKVSEGLIAKVVSENEYLRMKNLCENVLEVKANLIENNIL